MAKAQTDKERAASTEDEAVTTEESPAEEVDYQLPPGVSTSITRGEKDAATGEPVEEEPTAETLPAEGQT